MSLKILIVRLDLIGDLIVTTPIFSAIKKHMPSAEIDVLVNTYNYEVIAHNPNINKVHLYAKTSHAKNILNVVKSFINNIVVKHNIKKRKYDYAILCNCGAAHKALKKISNCNVKQIIGYIDEETKNKINLPVEKYNNGNCHEVQAIFNLLKPLGINKHPDPIKIYQLPETKKWAENLYNSHIGFKNKQNKVIGFQISSRRDYGRWSIENWVKIIEICINNYNLNPVIFWSPGSSKVKEHPGDDERAEELNAQLKKLNINALFFPSKTLKELFAGISICEYVFTPDGGTAHIAAAFDKKLVSYIKESQYMYWHPWCKNFITFTYINNASEVHAEDISEAIQYHIKMK